MNIFKIAGRRPLHVSVLHVSVLHVSVLFAMLMAAWTPWALAGGLKGAPAPFDKGGVRVALVVLVSGGDFFQAPPKRCQIPSQSTGH